MAVISLAQNDTAEAYGLVKASKLLAQAPETATVAPKDTVNPVCTLISPAEYAELAPYTPIVLDITDLSGLSRVWISVRVGGERDRVQVWNGEAFVGSFINSTRAVITDGHRYTLTRTRGWGGGIVVEVEAVDTDGNLITIGP